MTLKAKANKRFPVSLLSRSEFTLCSRFHQKGLYKSVVNILSSDVKGSLFIGCAGIYYIQRSEGCKKVKFSKATF